MRISDLVTRSILELLDEQNGEAEIKRNELANTLGCVPSQINYVITSRFTPEQGYIVESRRGGGGYIRITRVTASRQTMLMHIVNSIGEKLDKRSAEVMLSNLLDRNLVDQPTARLMASALGGRAYADVPAEYRDKLRAAVFKNMLLTIMNNT